MEKPLFGVTRDDGAGDWFRVRQQARGAVLDVRVRVAADEAGGLRIRELHVCDVGQPLTGNHLRDIPLAGIEHAIEAELASGEERRAGKGSLDSAEQASSDGAWLSIADQARHELADAGEATPPAIVPRRGHRRPDDFYKQVASWYREALRAREKPTPYIQAKAKVERSTAASWIQTARKKGFLRDTQRGRARA